MKDFKNKSFLYIPFLFLKYFKTKFVSNRKSTSGVLCFIFSSAVGGI